MTVKRLYLGDADKSRLIRLYYIETGRESDVEQFLCNLSQTDLGEFAAVVEYLDRIGETGLPKNKEKSRYLDKKLRIFELKCGRVRISAFWDEGRIIICANAFFKDSAKTKKRELQRARSLKKQYDAAKEQNQLKLEE